jgi:hypothetical protein
MQDHVSGKSVERLADGMLVEAPWTNYAISANLPGI